MTTLSGFIQALREGAVEGGKPLMAEDSGGFLVPSEIAIELIRTEQFYYEHPDRAAANGRAIQAAERRHRRFTASFPWRRWNRLMPDFDRRHRKVN